MSREPALLTSAGRMPERSQHRVSEGARRSRALPGERKPEPTPGRQRRRESRMPVANVRRRGMGSPEPSPRYARACSPTSPRLPNPRPSDGRPFPCPVRWTGWSVHSDYTPKISVKNTTFFSTNGLKAAYE